MSIFVELEKGEVHESFRRIPYLAIRLDQGQIDGETIRQFDLTSMKSFLYSVWGEKNHSERGLSLTTVSATALNPRKSYQGYRSKLSLKFMVVDMKLYVFPHDTYEQMMQVNVRHIDFRDAMGWRGIPSDAGYMDLTYRVSPKLSGGLLEWELAGPIERKITGSSELYGNRAYHLNYRRNTLEPALKEHFTFRYP